ncbi:MAG: zinc-binding dehydrogenase [bacterium]|nr:zinc-binding dehydrogenase [bacterium]
MKAAVLETIDAPLVVGDVEFGALERGQVLVKILVSGICGSQLQEIAGNKGNGKFVPHLLGHEGCGEVADVGADVTKVQKGDKVVLHWRKGDGIESDFPVYTYKGEKMPSGKVTTFSEYSVVSENRVTKVPADIPNDFCALLGCGLSTALATIENEARVVPGESVMIVGLGGLGACFIKAAVLAQARPIIAVDIHDCKKDAALALGANIFINSAKENIKEAVGKASENKGVNVIVETSGNKKSIEDTLSLLAGSGRYIMVGQPKPGENVELVNAVHIFGGEGKSIKATQGGQFSPARDIPRYIDLYRSGKLKTDDLVTHRTSLKDINEAITLIREGKANRIMIDIWQ